MRSIDIIIRDTIGNQAIQIIQLSAEIERLQELVKELEAKDQTELVD